MLRGHRTAFINLFNENDVISVSDRKGRNEELLHRRNECLAHRHYYYVKIARKQYGDVLAALVLEFHLTERTIVDILQKSEYLKILKQQNPDVKFFRKKYPHLSWD